MPSADPGAWPPQGEIRVLPVHSCHHHPFREAPGHQASSQGGHGKRRWWLLQSLIWKRFCSLFLLSRKHLLSGSIYWDTTRMTQLKISLIWKYNLASHVKRNKASDISIEPNISSQELKSSVLVLGHVSIRGLLFFKPCVMWPNWIIYNNFWEWTRQPGPSLKHKCWGRLQSAAALCFWMSCCNLNVSSHWELREVT